MAVLSVESKNLLKRVIDYYRHSLTADSAGMAFLRDDLNLHYNLVLEDFKIGYSDGTLIETLPEDPSVKTRLTKIGILNKNGSDKLHGCITVPLMDASGDIINLYARNIQNHKSRFIFRSGAGVINCRAFHAFDSVIVAPTVSDVLFLYDKGVQNCAYVYASGNLDESGTYYSTKALKKIIVIRFKAAGKKPCPKRLSAYFTKKEIAASIVFVPVRSAADYFQKHTIDDFTCLVDRAKNPPSDLDAKTSNTASYSFSRTEEGFVLAVNDSRKYEIKGVSKQITQLKVTIKAALNEGGSTPFELSTVDMYSYRARIWFARLCADLFAVSEDIIQADLHRVLEYAEQFQASRKPGCIELGVEDQKEAIEFLKDPNLLDLILDDFESIGVVGEQTNKLVGYLTAVSRKLDEPLSVLIQSRSAAGKSTLQDAILKLVPAEDVLKYTRITNQALFYSGENTFAHKVLAIEEGSGMKGAAYSIRNIQSSGKITIAAAGKSTGTDGLITREYTVKGPVAVMLTTTATTLDEETASRFIVLTIDESSQMTRAIHERHRRNESIDGIVAERKRQRLIEKHHNAQRLLKPVVVVNPYAAHLNYPFVSLKARRDFRKYLGLIKAVAFLHQYQRDKRTASVEGKNIEYMEVALADIERANALASEVLSRSLDDLPAPSRQLLDLIFQMVSTLAKERNLPLFKISITRRMIREHTGWTNWQIRTYLPPLLEMEYLVLQPGSRNNRYCYTISEGKDNQSARLNGLQLTSVSELKRLIAEDKQKTEKDHKMSS